ncbi:MAG: hypothetical protein L0215_07855 [Gemmataceae bacterium]|nr:hypothetical protein [Gemmataceae bacterium]
MALVARFDTPGSLRDLPAGSVFYDNWHAFVAGRLAASTPGSGGGEFYDPSEVDVNVLAERALVWMGFPRALMVAMHRDNRSAAFIAGEDRTVQEEYCEWQVSRNQAGKITKVVIVTEVPEYWEQLWAVDRARVVALYQLLVSPAVVEADLVGPGGVYNRFNRWNTTDGIVHFIQVINTLSAAFGLAQGSVNSGGALDNYEANPGPSTSVDPRVILDIGTLARKGLSISLREPIGLYIAGYDDTGWSKPDGTPVDNYWRIVRGAPGRILRLEYEVPAAAGFVVGDIRIGGRPIEWGGQIAEHITCTIGGIAGRRAP